MLKNITTSVPLALERTLTALGERIRLARKRRGMTLAELSTRMFVDEKTLRRLEKGDPGVGMGVLGAALFVLGLDDLNLVAEPSADNVGMLLERERLEKKRRVRSHNTSDVDMDF